MATPPERLPFGPVTPYDPSGPYDPKKLYELLETSDLTPLPVEVDISSEATVTVEVTPPNSSMMSIRALHSSVDENAGLILQALQVGLSPTSALATPVNVAVFNKAHLIPWALGCITNMLPMLITVGASNAARLSMTFWGKLSRNFDYTPGNDPMFQRPTHVLLLKALRAVKESADNVEDEDLRALLDLYHDVL